MSHGWTPERRAKQAEAIHRWKPWQESTGPKSPEGKARVSRNGWKGGTRPMLRELARLRSEEPTSELQSLMRISYAVFCLQNKISAVLTLNLIYVLIILTRLYL